MNGVYRSGGVTGSVVMPDNDRCAWRRGTLTKNSARGFRLNGVFRGGAYSHVSLRNTVFRRNGSYPQAHSTVSAGIGFL